MRRKSEYETTDRRSAEPDSPYRDTRHVRVFRRLSQMMSRSTSKLSFSQSLPGEDHLPIAARGNPDALPKSLVGAAAARPSDPDGSLSDSHVGFSEQTSHLFNSQHCKECQWRSSIGIGEYPRQLLW